MVEIDFSCNQFRTLTQFLNLVIQALNPNVNVKSIVVFNLQIQVAFPTTRYDVNEELPPLMTDLRPDLYISNLDLLELEKTLNKISTSYSFNEYATYLLVSSDWTTNFENDIFLRHVSKVVFVNSSDFGESTEVLQKTKLFIPEKPKCGKQGTISTMVISKNLNKGPVSTSLKLCIGSIWLPQFICINCTENRGIIIDVFDMFCGHVGISPKYLALNDLLLPYKNKLLLKECDVCYHGLDSENSLVDFIFAIRDDYDFWYVPRSPEIPPWKFMVLALPINIWVTWISISITVSLLKWTVERRIVYCLFPRKKHALKLLETVFKYFLEQQGRTDITLYSDMFFFYGIMITVFVLNVAYKTSFTWLLLGPNFYHQDIHTVHDAAEKGLFVTYSKHLKGKMETLYPELKEYFNTHFVHTTEQNWVDLVAFRKDTIALKTSLTGKYLKRRYLDENGRSLIDILEEPAQQSICGFIFLKGDPILSKMSKFINVLRDHGFLSLILSKYDWKDYDFVFDVKHRKLGFRQVKGPFLVWLVGSTIGFVVLILELILGRYI